MALLCITLICTIPQNFLLLDGNVWKMKIVRFETFSYTNAGSIKLRVSQTTGKSLCVCFKAPKINFLRSNKWKLKPIKNYFPAIFFNIFCSRRTTWKTSIKIHESILIIYILRIWWDAKMNSLSYFLIKHWEDYAIFLLCNWWSVDLEKDLICFSRGLKIINKENVEWVKKTNTSRV